MKQNTFDKKDGMLKKHSKKKFWKKVVAMLSCVTVFCTSYTMIMPAMTMSETTYCGQEEGENHTHTLQCYSNPNADLETEANWSATIPSLTGNWNEDAVAVADSQLGYQESTANYHVSDNNEKKGYTRYGAWMNDPYADWNTDFVLFCLHYANVDANALSLSNDISTWTSNGAFVSKDSYAPNAGDLIVLDQNNDGAADHAAIITEANGNAIRIVEGDLSDAVTQANYDTTDARVIGYIRMPQNPAMQTVAETAEETAAPVETSAPEETAQPEVTTVPETEQATVAETAAPEATAEPQETTEPEVTATPEATATAEAASTPEAMTTPETAKVSSKAKRRLFSIFRAPTSTMSINNFVTDVTIKINGQEVTGNTQWNVKAGSTYDLTIKFEETSNNQFPNDGTWMTYKIPEGLKVEDLDAPTFDMVVDGKTIKGNNMVVDKNNGIIMFQWNTSDPNFQTLTNSNDLYLNAKIRGSISADTKEIKFSDNVTRDVNVDTTHNVSVQKKGSYDPKDGKIHYEVTVNSSGVSKDIVVTDIITGTALTYNNDATSSSNKDNGVTPEISKKDNGFTATIPSMSDGETVIFKYTASVDLDKFSKSGYIDPSLKLTDNQVKITCPGDSIPGDDSAENKVNNISFSSLEKNGEGSKNTYNENGKTYRDITWNIKANNERKKHLTYISDLIAPDSQSILSYSGDGLTIVVTHENGAQEKRKVKWKDSSIEKTNTGWTYTPPTSDGKASYDVTYTTKADVTSLIDSKNVSNTAKTDYNSTTGSTTIDSTEENKLGASKKVSAVSSDKVTWEITVDVPAAGLDKLVVTDTLPNIWIQNKQHFDSLDNIISVEGLDAAEAYSVDSTSDPSKFTITFYKDKAGTRPGMNQSAGNRTVTIRYTTKNNEEWLDYSTQHPSNTYWMQHTNNVTVDAPEIEKKASATATINPSKHTVKKSGNLKEPYQDSNGTTWEILEYNITLGGATDDQVLTDTFDTEHLQYFDGVRSQWYTDTSAGVIYGGTADYQGDSPSKVTVTPTDTGITINTGKLPRQQDGSYYGYYRIHYYLKVKFDEMQHLALNNNGEVKFSNSVTWGTQGASADVSYSYPGVSKSCSQNGSVATYTIDVNPSKLEMNEGRSMQLVDTFTNQAIDYSTIEIKASDNNGKDRSKEVTYDFSGNTGTFTIPDSTHVVITYEAKPVGKVGESVKMTNNASMKAYHQSTETLMTIGGSASGGGDVVHLKVLKHAKDHMETKLSRAVFKLYDADGNVLKYDLGAKKGEDITFTTGSDGYADVMLSPVTEYSKGLEFGKTYKLKEVTAPDGYQLDGSYIPFTISKDGSSDNNGLFANGATIAVSNKKVVHVQVTLKKVDSQDASKTLSGAKFDLYGSDYVSENGAVNTNAAVIKKGLTTGRDGTVLLGPLTSGTYYLFETQAPKGYGIEKDPIKLQVQDDKVTVKQSGVLQLDQINEEKTTITVTDPQAYNLPDTGGTGTAMIYVAGGVLVAVAVVMLVMQKRKKN